MHKPPFRLLLIAIAAIYTAVLGMLAVLWRLRPQIWWVTISRIFAAHLFWPLVALVPAALLSRSRALQTLSLFPTILFAALFGRRFLPRLHPGYSGQHLRVATFNLNFRNDDLSAMLAAIGALEADVVMLQELTPHVSVGLTQHLCDHYPFQFLAPAEKQHGLGIISRLPFAQTHDEPYYRGQRVTLILGDRTLTLINAHPTIADISWRGIVGTIAIPSGYEPGLRIYQLANLLAAIDHVHGDLIVAGDFNTADGEPIYAEFASRLRDAFIESGYGFGFTFPVNPKRLARPPLVRIDYVWYRGAITARTARVIRANGNSDHRIVLADLVLEK